MKRIIFFLFVITSIHTSLGQNLCLNIDSIKVYSLPWIMKTTLGLDIEDVRLYRNEKGYSEYIVKDSIPLNEFSQINLYNSERLPNTDLDIRMVIDVYAGGKIITVGLNSVLFYNFLNLNFYRNMDLNNWLLKYILKPGDRLPR